MERGLAGGAKAWEVGLLGRGGLEEWIERGKA